MTEPHAARRVAGHDDLDESRICYWRTTYGWLIYIPGCGIGGLKKHTVTEHEDGTITVTPSILVMGHESGQKITRHGFLTHGEWKDVG